MLKPHWQQPFACWEAQFSPAFVDNALLRWRCPPVRCGVVASCTVSTIPSLWSTHPPQPSSWFPLHICGVKPTVSGGSPTVPLGNGLAVLCKHPRGILPRNLLL